MLTVATEQAIDKKPEVFLTILTGTGDFMSVGLVPSSCLPPRDLGRAQR